MYFKKRIWHITGWGSVNSIQFYQITTTVANTVMHTEKKKKIV